MGSLSSVILSYTIINGTNINLFPAMFKILWWHELLVTSAHVAFWSYFVTQGVLWGMSTEVTMFYLVFWGAYVVRLGCQCVWQFVQFV